MQLEANFTWSVAVLTAALALATLADAPPATAKPLDVNVTGDAEADYLAISGTGNSSGTYAASGFGDANATVLAASGTGSASAFLATSGTGDAKGQPDVCFPFGGLPTVCQPAAAVSGTGNATSCSSAPCVGASGGGDATSFLALAALGDAAGYAAASGTDDATATIAVSGSGDAASCTYGVHCVAVSALGSAEGTWAVSICDALSGGSGQCLP